MKLSIKAELVYVFVEATQIIANLEGLGRGTDRGFALGERTRQARH
jgi:hypothetical protein